MFNINMKDYYFRFPESFRESEEESLEEIKEICQKIIPCSEERDHERTRINEELEVIQYNSLAGRFMFLHELLSEYPDDFLGFGALNNSFIAYLLGITRINPFDFDLPFERFMSIRRKKRIPSFPFFSRLGEDALGECLAYNETGDISIQKFEAMDHIKKFLPLKNLDTDTKLFDIIREDINGFNKFLRHPVSAEILSRFPLRNIADLTFVIACSMNPHILCQYFWDEKEPVLAETHGYLCYQEQFIRLIQKTAKFTATEAEEFHRNICRPQKKNPLKNLYINYTNLPWTWNKLANAAGACICKGSVLADAYVLCNLAFWRPSPIV